MDLNKLKIAGVVVVVGCVLLISFLFWKKNNNAATMLKIDETEDVKGLGYTGQRKVVLDNNGNMFVAYRKKYQGKSEVFVAKVTQDKGGWKISGTNAPIAVVGSIADQRVPSIAVDSKNNLQIVWYGSDANSLDQTNNRQVKYARSSDGGRSWTSGQNIAPVGGYNGEDYWQEHPYILAGTGNELFVVWEGKDANNKNQQIKFIKSLDGGNTWTTWKNVQETPDGTQSRPTMVQDKNGRLNLFAYSALGNSEGKQQIVYTWSDDGGETWSAWEVVSNPTDDSRHVSASIAPDGAIHLVWRALNSAGQSQIVYRVLRGSNWSDMQLVAPSSRQYQFFPSIEAGPNGNITITWMESGSASGLPSEDPTDGKIFRSQISGEKISQPIEVSTGATNLYSSLPGSIGQGISPLIYETGGALSGKYAVMLKIN